MCVTQPCKWSAGLVIGAALALVLSACQEPIAGTADPESLGYGPPNAVAAVLLAGYSPDPVERRAPEPWNAPPVDRAPDSTQLAGDRPIPHSPEIVALCSHVEPLLGDAGEGCRASLRIAMAFRLAEVWRGLANCLGETESADAVAACHRDYPRSIDPGREHPEEAAACRHIIALAAAEGFGGDSAMEPDNLEAFRAILDECVVGMVEEQATVDPEHARERLRCVHAAQTSMQTQMCE